MDYAEMANDYEENPPTADEVPGTRFGIQKVGDPSTFMSWSHWTREDARQAAAYNSERWGEYEVVERPEEVSE